MIWFLVLGIGAVVFNGGGAVYDAIVTREIAWEAWEPFWFSLAFTVAVLMIGV